MGHHSCASMVHAAHEDCAAGVLHPTRPDARSASAVAACEESNLVAASLGLPQHVGVGHRQITVIAYGTEF